MWVHFFDPHGPYDPPEPFRSSIQASHTEPRSPRWTRRSDGWCRVSKPVQRAGGASAIVIAADHGEGLGDHGELQHGNLLYESTMRVPLAVIGPGVHSATIEVPVSTRRIFHTILDWAGLGCDRQPARRFR